MKLIDSINAFLFNRLIYVTRFLTENEFRNIIGKPALRFLANTTLVIKNGQPKSSVEDAAREWQKMFPNPELVPIVRIEKDTVFAEIHVHCPYRNTRNFTGCYRMMEYDRELLKKIGAELVVLKSQAEPDQKHCLVAITQNASLNKDLIPAHQKNNELWRES